MANTEYVSIYIYGIVRNNIIFCVFFYIYFAFYSRFYHMADKLHLLNEWALGRGEGVWCTRP